MTAGRPVVLTPLDWAERIAAVSLLLQSTGVHPEESWCIAAGVPYRPRPKPNQNLRGRGPVSDKVLAFLREQTVPVGARQIADALGNKRTRRIVESLHNLRRHGVVELTGKRQSGRQGQPENLWAVKP